MTHTTHWYSVILVIIAMIIGIIIQAEGLPDTVRKFIIIGSFFGMIGLCVSPMED